jgi:hypothetical protein
VALLSPDFCRNRHVPALTGEQGTDGTVLTSGFAGAHSNLI